MSTADSNYVLSHTVRTGPGYTQADLRGDWDLAFNVATRPDGRIVIGGQTETLAWGYPGAPGDESWGYRFQHTVLRLNANGSLDGRFHEGGVDIVPAPIPSDAWDYITSAQPDGKILMATAADGSPKHTLHLHRYNADGTPDKHFGNHGAFVFDTPENINGFDIDLSPDGSPYLSAVGDSQAMLIKLDSHGALVKGFGIDGVLTVAPVGGPGDVYRISPTLQPDGNVLLGVSYLSASTAGGTSDTDSLVYSLQRFHQDGSLDERFGSNGVLYIAEDDNFSVSEVAAVQSDGKVILWAGNPTTHEQLLARLDSDGSLDESFGTDGKVVIKAASLNDILVQADGKILATGSNDEDIYITRFNADGSLDTRFGSGDGKLHIDGYSGEEILDGASAAEIIHGYAGKDVLLGHGGRDVLNGGAGADIFRFSEISDSYRTSSQTSIVRIQDFNPSQDRIDLINLGFSGIGDGHHGTLAVQANANGTKTYLKSFEADASGQRFELAFDGHLAGHLNSTNIVFFPPTIQGTSGKEIITGSALPETIYGLAGNDKVNGGAGADVIIGGLGADQLNGGDRSDVTLYSKPNADADIFRYTAVEDSYNTATKSFSDLIVNLETYSDRIDVSALGYTGFGDGTGTTLKIAYSSALDRTYLKDLEADDHGHKFQIALTGNWLMEIDERNMIFASPTNIKLLGVRDEFGEGQAIG
ncbi:M10 family metallopeptidase C-terminal domain-containing protein [Pseudomonas massiliensis]|uniref:M10 family metallopeptidase C-terminal domain-containing protein n=1 Tax=Pseudomonas massiliensis TaxID=522492 RepID=UPI0006950D7B|nr:calcium-binding protein [Pseudomonas massiliensis]